MRIDVHTHRRRDISIYFLPHREAFSPGSPSVILLSVPAHPGPQAQDVPEGMAEQVSRPVVDSCPLYTRGAGP